MDFAKIFKDAFDIVMLKVPTMRKVAEDKEGLRNAVMMVALVSVIGALGYYVFPVTYAGYVTYRPDVMWLLGQTAWSFALGMGSLYLLGYLAEVLFKSKLSMNAFIRVAGLGMVVSVASIVPSLGMIASLWSLVIVGKVLQDLGKLEIAEIVILVVINIVIGLALRMSGIMF